MARDNLLTYPDFNETFKIHTNASVLQWWAVISQKGKPTTFYSRKLSDAKTCYTVTKRELLSIVETLNDFRAILLGQKLRIYTDHKNLPCNFSTTDRVLRWRLILEEYGPYVEYTNDEKNIVADGLSIILLNINQ